MFTETRKISIIGLGYVGLPIAIEFGKIQNVIGFDVNQKRIQKLQSGIDDNLEVSTEELKQAKIEFTDDLQKLKSANFHIVTVPTPINSAQRPDLTPLKKASETLGKVLKQGDVVVYESTVYPGATEEECVPILEKLSGLKMGVDFKVGYSPERINPGDTEHRFNNIVKVVSANDAQALEIVANTYELAVKAGVYKASSIKTAEAAKVIENTQRDLNIALMNELSLIFHRMGIDTQEVLNCAGTKWNFLKFTPGLVGGHCIGVDPYYLTHKAEMVGYHPQVILAGRRINDGMGKFIASETIKMMVKSGQAIAGNSVTVLGLTFKENCPDIRNSKVIDIISELKEYGLKVQVSDPLADAEVAKEEYDVDLVPFDELQKTSAVIVAVSHKQFKELSPKDFTKITNEKSILVDVKSIYNPKEIEENGFKLWRL